jgi:tetratricopeptide (TPR) repeat protein
MQFGYRGPRRLKLRYLSEKETMNSMSQGDNPWLGLLGSSHTALSAQMTGSLLRAGAVALCLFCAAHVVSANEGSGPVELPESVRKKIESLSGEGDALARKKNYREAVQKYIDALNLLPEPKTDWEACTWLLTAIGDTNFMAGAYEQARAALSDAMHCPGAIGNPFIHLRLGESQLELGNKERAADELARAYMGAGKKIFESEDPKYFSFLKTVLKPPADGQW